MGRRVRNKLSRAERKRRRERALNPPPEPVYRCQTCRDQGTVRTDTPSEKYFFCGCKYHTWCPDCTWRIRRWIESFILWMWPIS